MEITALSPQSLWKHFAAICRIPHPSGHEAGIREYIKGFAHHNGIEYCEDAVGNAMLIRPATSGREFYPRVIMQSHIDMVPQKNSGTAFDFLTDAIQPYIDGNWVKAACTTLGADNGIGIAAALAMMEDKQLIHGPLKAIFTVEEETGLTGALNLSPEFLQGDILLNLDSEEEGMAFIGCAGGSRTEYVFNCDREPSPINHVAIRVALTGLRGGHSGMEINLGRGNAIIILARILQDAVKSFDLRLAAINGGSLDNAIPREAFADIILPPDQEMELAVMLEKLAMREIETLGENDPGMKLTLLKDVDFCSIMEKETQTDLLKVLVNCPNGVIKMSESIPNLVETSTNLGVIKTTSDLIRLTCLQRSSCDSEREQLVTRMNDFFSQAGADVERKNSYPGWQPNTDSPVLGLLQNVYRDLFEGALQVRAIHAGLECGIFRNINPKLDMISFGPEIRSPHSPDEQVLIASVERFYQLLCALLRRID